MVIRFVLIIVFIAISIFSGEYDFDISNFEKKVFEPSLKGGLRGTVAIPHNDSYSWLLKYYNFDNDPSQLSYYSVQLEPAITISKNSVLMVASTMGSIKYQNSESGWIWDYNYSIYETYLRYELNSHWSFSAGKKLYKWGKGYIYNPVNFVGREKDLNRVDAAQEGFYTASVEFVKSINSNIIKNISQEILAVPVYKIFNDDFLSGDLHWLFSKTYMLWGNTDVELFMGISQEYDTRHGIAIAHNILSSWEIHGDVALIRDNDSSDVRALIGTRILTNFDATFFLEYIYNGIGKTEMDMHQFYLKNDSFFASDVLKNSNYWDSVNKQWFKNTSEQFLMQHYLYCKVQYPEPFNIIYLTPSIYGIFNIVDYSLSGGLDINYKRFNHFSFNGKVVGFYGDKKSEYGSKLSKLKIELSMDIYF